METASMGKVITAAKIENLDDLFSVDKGFLKPEQVRAIEVTDAMVDTGATTLSLPKRYIQQLGLRSVRTRKARTIRGSTTLQMYGTVRLTIQGRNGVCDVIEIPDDCPVLIGQIPLELLDFVVDPIGQRLIGNPDHGGEDMIDMF
jgi:predicted aspartyl protease